MAVHYFAGEGRNFDLPLSKIQDLENACGKTPFGDIYVMMLHRRFFAMHVYHTIRIALIGGGMSPVEAERLVRDKFDVTPMREHVELASHILLDVFEGVEGDGSGGKAEPLDLGAIFASFAKLGVGPDQIKDLSFRDFVNMAKAFDAKAKAPSEDEYMAYLKENFPELYEDAVNGEAD